jgi:WD40 repeat protein
MISYLTNFLSHILWLERNPTRIRNTILAVGPGTPASVLWRSRYGSADFDRERHNAFMQQLESRGMTDNDDDSLASNPSDYDLDEENEDDVEMEISPPSAPSEPPIWGASAPQPLLEQLEEPTAVDWLPSMRHDGCVNTASWLNCPWRLSGADGGMSLSSGDQMILPQGISSCCDVPTQVLTSGDDCMIKVWDLSNAMGSASPLAGGWDTYSPLTMTNIKELGSDEQNENWKNYYEERDGICKVAGSVSLLASVHSKHEGNVFHVSPIADAPGKVLSCGADGFLRLLDLESGLSIIVLDPLIHAERGEGLIANLLGGGFGVIAFSHVQLTGNTGLLCSQRGLFRYDIRVAPNVQPRASLLGLFAPCKACAVWSPSSYRSDYSYPSYMNTQSEPPYVFVDATGEFVELLDLRAIGLSSKRKVLQRYCPKDIYVRSTASVSGIDVSKDGRELLVSYENDQIYTFPVFHDVASYDAGPTIEEIDATSKKFSGNKSESLPHLAMYGGHLNRRTFLKNATYAGPNDDYILSGSDSGKAFIFNRSTTYVEALLSADSSTCNGIVAHPTLPFFVTYGIDASAKLWRACASQDWPAARAKASIEMPEYELSAVTRQWSRVQASLHRFIEKDIPLVVPNLIASDELLSSTSMDPIMMDIVNGSQFGKPRAEYGNALRCLDPLLRQTQYWVYRAYRDDRLPPVCLPHSSLSVTVSWNRLRMQALSLGMNVNPWAPWVFENKNPFQRIQDAVGFHEADLVPDYPSDWIFFDPRVILHFSMNFYLLHNPESYLEVLQRNFPDNPVFFGAHETTRKNFVAAFTGKRLPWIADERWPHQFEYPLDVEVNVEKKEKFSNCIMEETISVLKEGGNEAMKLGLYHKAAHRYDKAIQYCAVLFMEHPMAVPNHPAIHANSLLHLYRGRALPTVFLGNRIAGYRSVLINEGTSPILFWTSTLQILIALRLNLSLLLLKPECGSPSGAAEQAGEALKLLKPFVTRPGFIVGQGYNRGDQREGSIMKEEPVSTYRQAKQSETKAYFRLGCAQAELDHFKQAVKFFRLSLECSKQSKCDRKGNVPASVPPDPLVIQRIEETEMKLLESERTEK